MIEETHHKKIKVNRKKQIMITLHFDTSTNIDHFPHLWVELDEQGRVEVPVDQFLKVEAKEDGKHILKIVVKSAHEFQNRWAAPLQAIVRFQGADVEGPETLPKDERKIIEFIGDSITEGILIDVANCSES